jgi:putative drug exporter of the RND superfamily
MAAFVSRRAPWILATTVVFAVLALPLGGTVVSHLSSGANQFQDPASESVQAFDLLRRAAGVEPDPGVVALVRDGDPAAVRAQIAADPEIARAVVLDRFVLGFFRHGLDRRSDVATKRLQSRFAHDRSVVLGGGAVAAREIDATVRDDLERAEVIALPVILLLSLLVFRGLVGALIPPAVGAVAVGATLLLLRGVVEVMDVSVFALNLVTGLGLGLAIDYSLLMVSRYREELEHHGHTAEALRETMRTAGRAIVFSALTVAVAMASLAVFPLPFLSSMAVGGVIVSLASLAVALVPLPALLHLLGPRIDALAPRRLQRSTPTGGWGRLARAVMRRPLLVSLAASSVLVALALSALGLRFTGIDASSLPKSAAARQVADALTERGLRGVASPINAVLPTRPSPAVVTRLRTLPGVAGVRGPIEAGRGVWRVDIAPQNDALAHSTQKLLGRIRELLPSALLAGRAAAFHDQRTSLARSLPWALGLLGLTTYVLLFAFTGSVVLPLKALLMNVLTIGGALGLLVLFFQGLRGVDGLEQTQPILLGATAFGLSTDYAVFLLSRIRELRDRGEPNLAAVAGGLERTGRIVTAAALLFCVAIGTFASSRLVFVQELGVGTAAAVALDATIVRALLVPALMAILGEWNWWAPEPLRRLHRRLGLGET